LEESGKGDIIRIEKKFGRVFGVFV